jgi:protein-tyrosine phosphatase
VPNGGRDVWLNVLADEAQSAPVQLQRLMANPTQANAALGEPDTLPALFHCTTGKDRTRWAAAALLLLLGVPQDVVMQDFLRSNAYRLPAHQEQIDAFVAAGGDPAIPPAILGVKADYLAAA